METKLIEEAAGCGDRRGQRGGPPARLAHRSIITAGERDWTTEPVNGWTGPRTGPDRPIGDRVTHARSSSSSHSELHPHSTRFHKERKNNTLRPTLTISAQLRYLTRNMASNCRHATGRRSFSPRQLYSFKMLQYLYFLSAAFTCKRLDFLRRKG